MKSFQKIFMNVLLAVGLRSALSSCDGWLEIYPQNEQVSDYYWSNKEEVEAMLNGTYYYYRNMVTTNLIPYGELRAGQLFSRGAYSSLQEFRIKETDKNISNWGPFYAVINVANGVLKNAEKVLANDETYDINMLNSHKAEAYFMRALSYFYLVRNWKDVPLVLEPYEDDAQSYLIRQTSEDSVIMQIKQDITTALASGAAKEYYTKSWETKGRATKWSLYALMADVCLWSGDYDACINYCDSILMSSSAYAPRLLTSPTHSAWFSIFNPGNSNESILELQWSEEEEQLCNLPVLFHDQDNGRVYAYTQKMTEMFAEEYAITQQKLIEAVRTMYGGFYTRDAYNVATTSYCWKYIGSEVLTEKRTSEHYDVNFILYRVAEIVLMKAEALVMEGRYAEAAEEVNKLRLRSNLPMVEETLDPASASELEMLTLILDERATELAGEAKAWYDMLRMGRRNNYQYKDVLITARILEFNQSASSSWLRSVLSDNNALYLPVWEDEMENNPYLKQNPYYE